jgi:hypothetical protein
MVLPHSREGRRAAGNQQQYTFLGPLPDVSNKVNSMKKINKYITTGIKPAEIAT